MLWPAHRKIITSVLRLLTIICTGCRYTLISLCFLLSCTPVFAGDYTVIPGRRIGAVTLGMSRQAVHASLHASYQSRRLHNGIVQEDWVTRLKQTQAAIEQGDYWKWDFVTVYFLHDDVVQIEVNSPRFSAPGGLTTRSHSARWGRRFRPFRSTYQVGQSRDPGGYPAMKHFMAYFDDVRQGIAWREGGWGNLDPGPDPGDAPSEGPIDIIIVHVPGKPVIIDPDGDARFVLTSRDVHFVTQP